MSKYLLKDMVEKVKKPVEFKKEIIKKPIKNKSRYMLWSVAFISVVFFLFSISFLFGQAKVLVNPKIKEVVLNENLSAKKNGNVNDLSFDLVIIGGDESVTVKTLGEKDVNQKIEEKEFASLSHAVEKGLYTMKKNYEETEKP